METVGLFPIPLSRVKGALDGALAAELIAQFADKAREQNVRSDLLAHSALAEGHALLERTSSLLLPAIAQFGALLFGELLPWSIKEMWLNVLAPGGSQGLHNHANSFVSGIVYLTGSHPSSNTVFVKSPGGTEFSFNNTNARSALGPYNADKWVAPDPAPGDMLLFPSYLLHEVPINRGPLRSSLAFNAIPARLDSWGYTLTLTR
jgi:uncharacterized protein (TIGR02466 family)